MMTLVRPITLNFKEPIVFVLNLYIALIYGLVYIWFESFPIVFIETYHFTLGEEGLAFLGIFIGCFATIPPFYYWMYKKVEPQFDKNGDLKPEERLVPALIGGFCIPICLFWFGWTSRADIHWIVPIIGSIWFGAGSFLLFNAVLNYLGDAYPKYAASVLAGNDLMRSSFGAGFPLFASAMYKNLGTPWASSTLGFISTAFIPVPFLLYYVSLPAVNEVQNCFLYCHLLTRRDFSTEIESEGPARWLDMTSRLMPFVSANTDFNTNYRNEVQ